MSVFRAILPRAVRAPIKITGIPEDAYRYEVNGKSALECIMGRYQLTTDKDTGILNDPNAWSDDPRYILDLIGRIANVSVETVRVVDALPSLT